MKTVDYIELYKGKKFILGASDFLGLIYYIEDKQIEYKNDGLYLSTKIILDRLGLDYDDLTPEKADEIVGEHSIGTDYESIVDSMSEYLGYTKDYSLTYYTIEGKEFLELTNVDLKTMEGDLL